MNLFTELEFEESSKITTTPKNKSLTKKNSNKFLPDNDQQSVEQVADQLTIIEQNKQVLHNLVTNELNRQVNNNPQLFTSQHPKDSPEYIAELLATNPRVMFFDTETTGMTRGTGEDHDPSINHKIIELGIIGSLNQLPDYDHVFSQLFNPQRKIDIDASKVHGFYNQDLLDKPIFSDLMEEFLQFIQGTVLVAHNANFDVKFINRELQQAGHDKTIEDYALIVDSLVFSRYKHGVGRIHSLDALSKRYKVNIERKLHGALLDAEILCHVFYSMLHSQQSFFVQDNQSSDQIYTHTMVDSNKFNIPPVIVNEKELALHQQMLEKIGKKFPAIWSQLEDQ